MTASPSRQVAATVGIVEVAIFGGPEFFRRIARFSDDGAQVRACLLLAADQLEELEATAPPLNVVN